MTGYRRELDGSHEQQALHLAVVGMASRMPPDLHGPADLMSSLTKRNVSVGAAPDWRWKSWSLARSAESGRASDDVPLQGSYLSGVEFFDAEFFHIPPREARCMDPQQRILLELAWEALENSGVSADALRGSRTGVFVGVGSDDYSRLMQDDLSAIEAWSGIGGTLCGTANRISYQLDLRGPSLAVDTACSSSLTAFHLACTSLRAGECDLALVGGVQINAAPMSPTALHRAGALAPDGRCKSFSVAADGYGRGEGAGMVVLRSLRAAASEGSRVLAVVRGSAIGQDGRTQGIMAPSADAQVQLLRTAYRRAGVDPQSVGYVEAHGTGTRAGDAAEVSALRAVFGNGRPESKPCLIGSLKPNVGHLEAASGIAGVIKAVCCLQEGRVPPTVVYGGVAPTVNGRGLRLVDTMTDWPADETPRRCGVSSFGYGGSIAHVVLEESPPSTLMAVPERISGPVVLQISAASDTALQHSAQELVAWMAQHSGIGLAAIAHTLSLHRSHLQTRAALIATTRRQALTRLHSIAEGRHSQGVVRGNSSRAAHSPGIVWVFSGHGSQWRGMGAEMIRREPIFRSVIESLEGIFRAELGVDLGEELTEGGCQDVGTVQPLLFAMQIGVAKVLESYEIFPTAVIGHSVGEIAAAVVAGMLTLEGGARLVCRRSRLLRTCAGNGAMALVDMPFETTIRRLDGREDLVAAVDASPTSTVVSGTMDALQAWTEELSASGHMVRPVDSSGVAFHSPAMDAITGPFTRALSGISVSAPRLAVYSTAISDPRSDAPRDATYWAANLRQPVRFMSAAQAAVDDGYRTFVEVSPHPVITHSLSEFLEHVDDSIGDTAAIPTLRRGGPADEQVLLCLAALHCRGVQVSWKRLAASGQFVPLPNYPWERQRYWIGDSPTPVQPTESAVGRPRVAPLVHQFLWEAGDPVRGRLPRSVVIVGDDELTRRFAQQWSERGIFVQHLRSPDDFRKLKANAEVFDGPLIYIPSVPEGADALVRAAEDSATHMVKLIQNVTRYQASGARIRLWVITRGVRHVESAQALAHAAVLGIGRIAAAEMPEAWGGVVDLEPAQAGGLHEALLAVVASPTLEDVLYLDARGVWVPRLVPTQAASAGEALQCSADTSYLITGAFGAVGTKVAQRLTERGARHLTLVGRHPQQSAAYKQLAERGVMLRVLQIDITDPGSAIQSLIAEPGHPTIRGVAHAAGMLAPRLLHAMTDAELIRTMQAKVHGAWLLHETFPPGSVDFFLLPVSMGSFTRIAGQAGYAASNAFVEALSTFRHAAGDSHTTAVAWPALRGGLGMASTQGPEAHAQGVGDIQAAEALDGWEYAHGLGLDRAAVLQVLPPSKGSTRLPLLSRLSGPDSTDEVQIWRSLTGDALRTHIAQAVIEEIGQGTGLSTDAIDIAAQLESFGMDSLMAVSVRTALQARLGIALPATLFLSQPTANHVTDRILKILLDLTKEELPS
ncbi:SDR family NAD(P)-dependent oxidoreductase [Streptomyces sp. b94]|nr:SDR family NAD(P)-dependent oxidoreductase [Streptomyces sp. b94]